MKSATKSSEIVGGLGAPSSDSERVAVAPPPAGAATERWSLVAARLDARLGGGTTGRIVVIASAERGDGRTTAALELSRALVDRLGRRTLLVDADPKLALERASDRGRRGLASLFAASPAKSLGELVRSGARHGDTVLPVGSGSLQFACEQGGGLVDVIRGAAPLRQRFDYVLFDTPALSVSADAALLARAADGVVLVIRPGGTRRRALSGALDALVDAPLVGCVLVW